MKETTIFLMVNYDDFSQSNINEDQMHQCYNFLIGHVKFAANHKKLILTVKTLHFGEETATKIS